MCSFTSSLSEPLNVFSRSSLRNWPFSSKLSFPQSRPSNSQDRIVSSGSYSVLLHCFHHLLRFFFPDTWSVNIFDNSRDTSSDIDVNKVVKDAEVANSVEDDSIDDLNDLNENLNNLDHGFKDMENLENAFSVQPDTLMKEENFAQHETQKEEEVCNVHKPNIVDDAFNVSKPPGFEHFKRSPSHSSKCSTFFANHHKKDEKVVLLILA
ncbi:hypothetical protein Tco_1522406 [Tanacetum coccineum]